MPSNGRSRIAIFDVSDKLEHKYLMLQRCDCQLEAEHITTERFSVKIKHTGYGDYAIKITESLSKVPRLIEDLLESFDEDEFDLWLKIQ